MGEDGFVQPHVVVARFGVDAVRIGADDGGAEEVDALGRQVVGQRIGAHLEAVVDHHDAVAEVHLFALGVVVAVGGAELRSVLHHAPAGVVGGQFGHQVVVQLVGVQFGFPALQDDLAAQVGVLVQRTVVQLVTEGRQGVPLLDRHVPVGVCLGLPDEDHAVSVHEDAVLAQRHVPRQDLPFAPVQDAEVLRSVDVDDAARVGSLGADAGAEQEEESKGEEEADGRDCSEREDWGPMLLIPPVALGVTIRFDYSRSRVIAGNRDARGGDGVA